MEHGEQDIHNLQMDPTATCHFPCEWICHHGDSKCTREDELKQKARGGAASLRPTLARAA
jgi:hypothetical protein